MAGLDWSCSTAEIALVAATAKTALQLIAATNTRFKIGYFGFWFDGTSATAEPVQVRILFQTTAIGGTPTANNPTKQITTDAETIQTTGAIYGTSPTEPTAGNVLRVFECHPQQGWAEHLPLGREIAVPGGQRLGFEFTAPAGVNVRVAVEGEE
jgi:hypothetical protein